LVTFLTLEAENHARIISECHKIMERRKVGKGKEKKRKIKTSLYVTEW
jgi:hypothetical protein